MMGDLEVKQVTHHVFDLLYPGVAEFDYLAAIDANGVVVLFEAVGFLVLGQVFAELVFFHQIAGGEQFQSIVHRGAADPVVPVFHVDVQRLGVEVVAAFVNFFQYGKTFGRFAQAAFFQVRGKNIQHFLDNILFVALHRHKTGWQMGRFSGKINIKTGSGAGKL